ncbi:hypothetical protein SAMN05421854_101480 [Amycolatopsis rubida]|uniref:Uncharacterized protein n=1 Tax=Amycolatopsis rubida TaxID=112413 RepID=A0A1I5E456_9PSEU|nr:hypothetical protein SAMN05421854_101480 [Amycolatopsis rubida]
MRRSRPDPHNGRALQRETDPSPTRRDRRIGATAMNRGNAEGRLSNRMNTPSQTGEDLRKMRGSTNVH